MEDDGVVRFRELPAAQPLAPRVYRSHALAVTPAHDIIRPSSEAMFLVTSRLGTSIPGSHQYLGHAG